MLFKKTHKKIPSIWIYYHHEYAKKKPMFTTTYMDLLPSLICQKNPYVHYHLYGSITIINIYQTNPMFTTIYMDLLPSLICQKIPMFTTIYMDLLPSLICQKNPMFTTIYMDLLPSLICQKISMFTQKIPDFPITKAITLFIATSEQILLQEMTFSVASHGQIWRTRVTMVVQSH